MGSQPAGLYGLVRGPKAGGAQGVTIQIPMMGLQDFCIISWIVNLAEVFIDHRF